MSWWLFFCVNRWRVHCWWWQWHSGVRWSGWLCCCLSKNRALLSWLGKVVRNNRFDSIHASCWFIVAVNVVVVLLIIHTSRCKDTHLKIGAWQVVFPLWEIVCVFWELTLIFRKSAEQTSPTWHWHVPLPEKKHNNATPHKQHHKQHHTSNLNQHHKQNVFPSLCVSQFRTTTEEGDNEYQL